jgi:hypothetical protein
MTSDMLNFLCRQPNWMTMARTLNLSLLLGHPLHIYVCICIMYIYIYIYIYILLLKLRTKKLQNKLVIWRREIKTGHVIECWMQAPPLPFPISNWSKKKTTLFLQVQPSIMAHNDFSMSVLSYTVMEERSKYKNILINVCLGWVTEAPFVRAA